MRGWEKKKDAFSGSIISRRILIMRIVDMSCTSN
jgi:hypothetical protein